MALRLLSSANSIRPCDITSPISQSIRDERPKLAMPASFHKFDLHIIDTLGSKTAALLFCALEYRFQKKPLGFYKFMSPCKNPFYKSGDSLSEELRVDRKTVQRALKIICVSYKSKSDYLDAIKTWGDMGAFQGKPYLSYFNKITHQTFYLRNYQVIEKIQKGTYKNDLYVNKCPLHGETLMSPTRGDKMSPTRGDKMSPGTTEKTFQRIPLSLSLSEQPQEEEKKIEVLGNTEQPGASVEIVSQMIETWRRVTQCDLSASPNKATVDNLSNSLKDLFGSSLHKWEAYCMLILSSKYLMGETVQKFKLNLAWAAKPDTIVKITEGHYTTGDRINVIYLDLEPISDPDPIILRFKHTCLHKMGKAKYISWIKPMGISRNINGEIVCVAPTIWFAKHISTNDFLGFGYFLNELSITGVVVKFPDGKQAGVIYPHSSK